MFLPSSEDVLFWPPDVLPRHRASFAAGRRLRVFEFSKMEGKFYGKIVRYLKPLDAFTSRGSKRSDLGITLSGPFLKHHRCRKTHMGSPAQVVPIKTQGGKAVGPLSVFRAFKGGSLRFPPETSR